MKTLSYSKTYLCGPIESDPKAARWRVDLAAALYKIDPTISVWDPLIKPDWVHPNIKNDTVAFGNKKYIFNHRYESTSEAEKLMGQTCFETNKEVRRICKTLAGKCDFMIARISKTFTWGSIDELEIAIDRHIPIFLWLPDGPISIYGIAGCIYDYKFIDDYTHFAMEHLLDKIRDINEGTDNLPSLDPDTWLYLTWRNAAEDPNA
jgi:hypothetical protein